MSAKELGRLLGQTGLLLTNEGLNVRVSILDAKLAWGATRVQVKPIEGYGTTWVDKGRVRLENATPAL